MIKIILYIVFSILAVLLLWYISAKFNESIWLFCAMVLLTGVSVFNGRWHEHFKPLVVNYEVQRSLDEHQSDFQSRLDAANRANNHLQKQLTEYKHGDNGTEGFWIWKHPVRSRVNLGHAQDNALHASQQMVKVRLKPTGHIHSDFKARKRVGSRMLNLMNRHKYVGNPELYKISRRANKLVN